MSVKYLFVTTYVTAQAGKPNSLLHPPIQPKMATVPSRKIPNKPRWSPILSPIPQDDTTSLLLIWLIVSKIHPEVIQALQVPERVKQTLQVSRAVYHRRPVLLFGAQVEDVQRQPGEVEVFADEAAHDRPGAESGFLGAMGDPGVQAGRQRELESQ